MKIETVSIKHSFTDAERLQLGEDQSNLLMRKDTLEAQLKATSTQMKADIEACQGQIRAVSSRLSSRYEMRNVECLLMDHRKPGVRFGVRTDNGHVATFRKLRADEMQVNLTDETPEEYIAIGIFPVDSENFDGDFVDLHVFASEFEALRTLPDVTFRDLPVALIGDAKGNHKQRKQPPVGGTE